MSIISLSMAVLPCRAEEDVEAGSAALRLDWPVYPRRAEHNTIAEGGNREGAETARQNGSNRAGRGSTRRPPAKASVKIDVAAVTVEGSRREGLTAPSYGAHALSIPASLRMTSLKLSPGPRIAPSRSTIAASSETVRAPLVRAAA